ncbi:uncharacterized protein LOC131216916 [Magnolia sinica]|uniref:uncharacterized protein LOC131216916 n=1 Tax=Magnolia sinica TaxID=86752 RepID=UPI00265B2EEC|nr:uncharacterized protein LOC131216916 [Magnolia sinica]
MSRTWEDLPSECWESIFRLLKNPNHLQTLSLVSKSFLSLTNTVRSSLTIYDPTAQILSLPRLFLRFPHLTHIKLATTPSVDLDPIIRAIARSHLNLHSLDLFGQRWIPIPAIRDLGRKMDATLRILSCRRLQFLDDRDLIAIADSFPSLEVLDIAYPEQDLGSAPPPNPGQFPGTVTDAGIVELSSKLRNLRSIDVSGNHFISDKSLDAISLNCGTLAEIVARDCSFVTCDGVRSVICRCPNLVSLSINRSRVPPSLIGCVGKSLSCLNLSQMVISDELLFSTAKANLPLQKLAISRCQGFTFVGILMLLSAYQSLHHLDLEGADFLTDGSMLVLSEYLRNIISINLKSCARLKNSTFFNLAMNCHFLEEICMERTGLGEEDSMPDLVKNPCIHTLKLAWNKSLSDETLKGVGSICSGLRSLDVSHCWSVTENGIGEIGKRCTEITELKVNGCGRVRNIGMGVEFLKLEILRAAGSGIGDEGLAMMARQGCRALRMLDLEGCLGVTKIGVKELLGSNGCVELKEVNLKNCCNVSADVLAWMVFSRPSLRKIGPPSGHLPMGKQRELFLRHGCMVCNGEF